MYLKDINIEEVKDYCNEQKNKFSLSDPYNRYNFNDKQVEYTYNLLVKDNVHCIGNRSRLYRNGELQSYISSDPLKDEDIQIETEWNLKHYVFCRVEWLTRCARHNPDIVIGYESKKILNDILSLN